MCQKCETYEAQHPNLLDTLMLDAFNAGGDAVLNISENHLFNPFIGALFQAMTDRKRQLELNIVLQRVSLEDAARQVSQLEREVMIALLFQGKYLAEHGFDFELWACEDHPPVEHRYECGHTDAEHEELFGAHEAGGSTLVDMAKLMGLDKD